MPLSKMVSISIPIRVDRASCDSLRTQCAMRLRSTSFLYDAWQSSENAFDSYFGHSTCWTGVASKKRKIKGESTPPSNILSFFKDETHLFARAARKVSQWTYMMSMRMEARWGKYNNQPRVRRLRRGGGSGLGKEEEVRRSVGVGEEVLARRSWRGGVGEEVSGRRRRREGGVGKGSLERSCWQGGGNKEALARRRR